MDLSIVIVTYNSRKFIINCLDSARRAARGVEHEIIVVDNNSGDGTKDLVKQFSNSILLLENLKNLGFAKAVNAGLRRASGEFILLLNPDTVIQSESFYPVIEFLRKNANIGICGGKLLNADDSLQYSTGSFPTLFSTLSRRVLPRRMRKYDLWSYDKTRRCDWVTGAFMLVRGGLIKEVGYFDEAYFMYYEDVDYCLQAKNRGWETYYFPGVTAYHLEPHARSRKDPITEHQIRKGRSYFFEKNRSFFSYYMILILTGSNRW